jgi:hypothetical protein
MIPYARLTPGPGFQAVRALFYYAQRMATAPVARRALSALIAAVVRMRQGGAATWPRDGTCRRALADLRTEGIALLPPLLSELEVAQFVDYFAGQQVVGPDGRYMAAHELPAETVAAAYSLETVLACPGLLSVLNSPRVLRIASDYLGCKPTLSSIGVRWTFPGRRQSVRFQQFHRDVDDWRFLKLFIYLSTVDEDAAHTFVRGSHAKAFGLTATDYTQDGLETRFGAQKLAIISGPRGTTFMADTLGVHRAGRPTERGRLVLQAQYSLLPVFAFLYQPVEHQAPSVDAYCNRLFLLQGASSAGATATTAAAWARGAQRLGIGSASPAAPLPPAVKRRGPQ